MRGGHEFIDLHDRAAVGLGSRLALGHGIRTDDVHLSDDASPNHGTTDAAKANDTEPQAPE